MVEAPVTDDRPNIVVVILDSLRSDHVDLDPGGATPNLARLASSGLLFERAVATAGWTLPSHVSMMTGLLPTEHGVVSVGSPRETLAHARTAIARFAGDGPFLPVEMRSLGYATFLGSSNVWVGPGSGFARWFDSSCYASFPPGGVRSGEGPAPVTPHIETARLPGGLRSHVPLRVKHAGRSAIEAVRRNIAAGRSFGRLFRWAVSHADKGATEIIDGFATWLAGTDRPFFAFFNLIETHEPHVDPRARGLGDVRAILDALRFRGPRLHRHNWADRRIPDSALARIKQAYRREVAYADQCVGTLIALLEGRGLLEKTVIVIAGDHGESFGEQGIVGHGLSLGESVARTALMLSGPGIPRGDFISGPASLRCLAPTVSALAGGRAGRYGIPSLLSAEAVGVAQIEAEPPGEYFRPAGMRSERVPEHLKSPAAAFYWDRYKLIVGSMWGRALYDLDADPAEQRDLTSQIPLPRELAGMEAAWTERTGSRSV
jgi:arylsulfatase A-like enzyme